MLTRIYIYIYEYDQVRKLLVHVFCFQQKDSNAMGMLLVLLSSSVCLCLLSILIKFLHRVWWTPICIQHMMRAQGIKGPSYRFFYGNAKQIFQMRKESMSIPMDISHHIFPRIQPHIYSWCNIYGKNFVNWYGPQAQLVVTDTEMIKEIMNNRDGAYPKPKAQGYMKKLLGDGLSTSEGDKWVKQRKLANQVFHGECLKVMIPAMIESTEMMLERWKHDEGKEIEVFEEFRVMTSEVISRTAFGSSYLQGKDIFEMLFKLSLLTFRNFFEVRFRGMSKIFKSDDDIEAEKLEKGIQDSMIEMIKKREEKVMSEEMESFGSDFLGLLLNANHDADENKRITVEDMVDECKTFYIAGQVTTKTLLTWTVFLLAVHQDWQEEARKEVLKQFGQQIPNSDGIARLKTMNMIIHESLRLYPPVVSVTRNVRKEVRMGKLLVPANVNVNISILALHHDPVIWGEDAHLFKPDRFSEGVAKATNNNMAVFLPFGLGPRTCVGLNFATTEAKIALSMILQRYSFSLSPAYVHSPFHLLTLCPQHGVRIMLHAV